jgi:RNA polymerase sigma factor (sigma-70 family)
LPRAHHFFTGGIFPYRAKFLSSEDSVHRPERGDAPMPAVAVENHLGLVANIARRVGRGCRLPLEDLVQEGCLGLLYAARSFDPGKGCQFTTFAAPAVRWFILKALARVRPTPSFAGWTEEDRSPRPGRDSEIQEEVERLLRCLRPDEERIIAMRFGFHGFAEMSAREVASRLGVSRQRVDFLFHRGLARMRSLAR